MIRLPTKTEIETLQAFFKPHSVSLYASYIAPTSANNPNRIQLKNLLKEARRLLASRGLRSTEIAATLQPAEKLLDGDEFRVNHTYSLALFMHPEIFAYYRLPADEISTSVTVGRGFDLQPIMQLIENNVAYYVLLLSHNNVQLFQGDNYYIEQLPVQNMPVNMEQALNIDEYPNDVQTHSVAPADRGKGSNAFHGQYNEAQVDKELLIKFFRRIDRKLHDILKNTSLPLIIAGVDYLLPLYRQVNTYPHLLVDEIRGSLERSPLEFIHQQAYERFWPATSWRVAIDRSN